MSKKQRRYIGIVNFIFLFVLTLSIIILVNRIYLCYISYNESFSAPLFLIVFLDVYLYMIVILIILIGYYFFRKINQKMIVHETKAKHFNCFKARPIRMTLIIVSIFATLFLITIVIIQPIILYHPNHSIFAYEKLREMNIYKTYEIIDENKTYQGFGYVDESKKLPTIIYFGGNGESSAQTFYHYHLTGFFDDFEGYQFIMIDYPGYGLSQGRTTDDSMKQMGEKVFEYIYNLDYVDQSLIYVYGYSIGTGVATYVASIKDIKGLILIAPYSNITDLFNSRFSIFHGIFRNLIVEEFDSMKYGLDVDVKPLIIASQSDETIPLELSLKLADIFKYAPDIYILEKEAHNEFLNNQNVINQIISYLNE